MQALAEREHSASRGERMVRAGEPDAQAAHWEQERDGQGELGEHLEEVDDRDDLDACRARVGDQAYSGERQVQVGDWVGLGGLRSRLWGLGDQDVHLVL